MLSDSAETLRMLQQIHDGDQTVFEELFRRNRVRLRRHIDLRLDAKLRTRVDPSDVVQETHMVAVRNLKEYLAQRPMPFHLWLQKMAHERTDQLRRRHRTAARRSVDREVSVPDQTTFVLTERFRSQSPGPLDELARRDLESKVQAALSGLSERDRDILTMRYVEKLDNVEIGYILDMHADAISKRHGRALLKLAKLLRETGIEKSDVD